MTLQARKIFQDGGLWTLRQWYLVVKGRLATDPRDLIFGGLSLIEPDLLSIDPIILSAESVGSPIVYNGQFVTRRYYPQIIPLHKTRNAQKARENTEIAKNVSQTLLIPNGLWPKLKADYTAHITEVFLQAAACLLTHTGTAEILSLAARTSRPEASIAWMFNLEHEIAVEDIPSWTPVPSSWTVSILPLHFPHMIAC